MPTSIQNHANRQNRETHRYLYESDMLIHEVFYGLKYLKSRFKNYIQDDLFQDIYSNNLNNAQKF